MQIMEVKQCVKDSNQLGEVFTSGIFLSGRKNCTEGMFSKNEKIRNVCRVYKNNC